MRSSIESSIVIGVVAMFGGWLVYAVLTALGRDTTAIKTWLGRLAALWLFAFISYGTFMCYKDAFVLSRRGTPAIAHAEFKRSYLPRRRAREVFVYNMTFDGHKIEKEYHYPLQSNELRVLYDPLEPEQFMIGERGSALQLFRTDTRGDFFFIFVWPVLILATAVGIFFSWRRRPSTIAAPREKEADYEEIA
jgi:hypothetical protein